MTIILTIAYGNYTTLIEVNDWKLVMKMLDSFDKLDTATWLRVQQAVTL